MGGMEADDLGALLRQYVECGRETAVEDLVSRTRSRLLVVAKRIGAPQDAEDAVQAAYLALVSRREPLDAPVLPWLLRATIRIAYRRKAIERRQHALAGRLERPRDEPSAAAAAMSAEERARVRAQLDLLPDRYRDVLVLHYLEDLTTSEIAALQDAPEPTVRTRLRRGRELLRGPLAPLWNYGLLALPWLVRDTSAATGGLVVKKKAALAGALLLLALAGGVAVTSKGGASPSASRSAPPAAAEQRAEAPAEAEPQGGAAESVRETPCATGIVLDPEGRPIGGAAVRVQAVEAELPPRPFGALFKGDATGGPGARTGPDGSFRVELDEDTPPQPLLVEARGHSPARVADVRHGAHVVVTLDRAPAISGTVRDLAGNPVPGARVAWWVFADRTRVERRGVAAEDGAYRIEDLPSPGSWDVEGYACCVAVRADGFAPVVTEGPMLRRGGDDEMRFDVWLTQGSVIEGRVIDVETREPLPGASVALSAMVSGGAVVYEETRADSRGLFTFRSFPVDGFHAVPCLDAARHMGWVRAEAEGHAPSTIDVPAVEGGKTLPLEVCCWPTATVQGRAVDGEGRPVEGATVSGFRNLTPKPSNLDLGGSSPAMRTDATGAFRWTDIPALSGKASPMHVYAHREGRPVKEAKVEVRAGETTTVRDFVFDDPPPPSVIAEVVDETGAPVHGASVGVHPVSGKRTGRDGRARLFMDAVRECRLAAGSARSGVCLSAPFVPSVEDPPVVRVVLDATHVVEGAVENTDGVPVPAAQVSAWRGEQPIARGRADKAGRFRLGRLPAGAVDLTAEEGGRKARVPAVPVDSSTALVVLPRAEVVRTWPLEGVVRDPATGETILRFTATLQGATWLHAERTAPGRFRFDAVPEGRWTLLLSAPGYAARREPVEVVAARPPDPLRIDLRGGATVAGRIDNRAGIRLLGATLYFLDDRGAVLEPTRLSGTGRFRIEAMEPGRYWPSIDAPGHVALLDPAEPLVVPEGATEVSFDLAIVEGGTLAIPDAEGAERVEVADAAGRTVRLWLAPSGKLRVNLPAGEYAVNGRRDEVTSGRVTEAHLRE